MKISALPIILILFTFFSSCKNTVVLAQKKESVNKTVTSMKNGSILISLNLKISHFIAEKSS
jgi:hypothetical protein